MKGKNDGKEERYRERERGRSERKYFCQNSKRRNEKRSKTQKTTCNKEKEERKDMDISLTHNNV